AYWGSGQGLLSVTRLGTRGAVLLLSGRECNEERAANASLTARNAVRRPGYHGARRSDCSARPFLRVYSRAGGNLAHVDPRADRWEGSPCVCFTLRIMRCSFGTAPRGLITAPSPWACLMRAQSGHPFFIKQLRDALHALAFRAQPEDPSHDIGLSSSISRSNMRPAAPGSEH